jgi:hypothetical protein
MNNENEKLLDVLYDIRMLAIKENRQEHANALQKAIEIIGDVELLCENIKVANQKIEELEMRMGSSIG